MQHYQELNYSQSTLLSLPLRKGLFAGTTPVNRNLIAGKFCLTKELSNKHIVTNGWFTKKPSKSYNIKSVHAKNQKSPRPKIFEFVFEFDSGLDHRLSTENLEQTLSCSNVLVGLWAKVD